jgi:predicted glycogen debranching enzyme
LRAEPSNPAASLHTDHATWTFDRSGNMPEDPTAAPADYHRRMLSFGPRVCGRLDEGGTREWLVPDGRGGYAMGTVSGLRTRRYHGLLVVSGDPPAVRHLGLASLDPVLIWPSGAQVRLASHEWASGAVEPQGHRHLERFDLVDGVPRWRWRIGDLVLERELAMTPGRPDGRASGAGGGSVAVVHRLVSGGPVRLDLAAVCTWRDAHGERTASGSPPEVAPVAGGAVVAGAYRLSGPDWRPAGEWWHGAHYREEAARGLPPREDLWYAGRFGAALGQIGDTVEVSAWAGDLDRTPPPAPEVVDAARRRNRAVVAAARPAGSAAAALTLAADAFVVTTAAGPDVVAGYPWFGAWSRDTMTAYEGLFLSTGRASLGRQLLTSYAATLSDGMLANTADTGRTEYNTADATLWFLHAVDRHVVATGDTDLAAELAGPLLGVVEAHLAGTRYGIRVDPADGLLSQNDAADKEALTWMDARVDGRPVTPRAGKAVDINALWVNGLAAVAALAERAGRAGRAGPAAGQLRARYESTRASFRQRFPAPAGWLHDVYPHDASLRPNQLLAYSLPYAPMAPDPALLRTLGAALLTPVGLRSLAPGEDGYTGRHRGGPADRDRAYHQGTVWPWLLGPYADACRRAGLDTDDLFAGVEAHLSEWGLGSVTETADGQPPHAATGCPFQAWSVAEVLRHLRHLAGKPA